MRAKVSYTCDWHNKDASDQGGRITIEPETGGQVQATWSCHGGMGDGCELVENTTAWSDEFAERVLDTPDLCQGIGEFVVEVTTDTPWPEVELAEWLSN